MLFIVGCGTSTSSLPNKPIESGNDGRIQQYLEENILGSENAICNFEKLNQPNGNVVEVWALCEEFVLLDNGSLDKNRGISLPVKITFASPTIHIVPADGEGYTASINDNFSKKAVEKIFAEEVHNVKDLEKRNRARAEKWLLSSTEK